MIMITNPPNEVGDYDYGRHNQLRGLHQNASPIFVTIHAISTVHRHHSIITTQCLFHMHLR